MDITLLAFTAHPDDEGACGGTLAKYADMGARAYVACATRGDGMDAKSKDPAITTREALGQARMQELACACEKLGVQPPIILGFQDGEIDHVPVEEAAWRAARLIRELKPQIVLTHDPLGGYGHPDHIAVSQFVTRAFALAGDRSAALDGLPAHSPLKLYYWATPRSFMEQVPAFRERRADIRGQQLGFVGVPDEQITTEIDIRAYVPRKLDALACHRTQFELDEEGRPKTFAASVPEAQRLQLFGHERFILANARMANANTAEAHSPAHNAAREVDLLAGIS
jgi:LmbE family N-acetylglucosaminyl deacetylase